MKHLLCAHHYNYPFRDPKYTFLCQPQTSLLHTCLLAEGIGPCLPVFSVSSCVRPGDWLDFLWVGQKEEKLPQTPFTWTRQCCLLAVEWSTSDMCVRPTGSPWTQALLGLLSSVSSPGKVWPAGEVLCRWGPYPWPSLLLSLFRGRGQFVVSTEMTPKIHTAHMQQSQDCTFVAHGFGAQISCTAHLYLPWFSLSTPLPRKFLGGGWMWLYGVGGRAGAAGVMETRPGKLHQFSTGLFWIHFSDLPSSAVSVHTAGRRLRLSPHHRPAGYRVPSS